MYEMVDLIMQWLVLPMALLGWHLFNRCTKHETEIAVLKTQIETAKLSYDREMKEIKDTIKQIFNKLDNIEQALREK
jgi:hypothetical protein